MLLPYFDLYVWSLSCGYKKPNPKGLKDISEHFGIAPDNMVMIGDTSRDDNIEKQKYRGMKDDIRRLSENHR